MRSLKSLEPSSVSMDDAQSFIHHELKTQKRKVSSWNKKLSTL